MLSVVIPSVIMLSVVCRVHLWQVSLYQISLCWVSWRHFSTQIPHLNSKRIYPFNNNIFFSFSGLFCFSLYFSHLYSIQLYSFFTSKRNKVWWRHCVTVSQLVTSQCHTKFKTVTQLDKGVPKFEEIKVSFSALFTFLVGWHASAVACPLVMSFLPS
jgi:hypothetical protein